MMEITFCPRCQSDNIHLSRPEGLLGRCQKCSSVWSSKFDSGELIYFSIRTSSMGTVMIWYDKKYLTINNKRYNFVIDPATSEEKLKLYLIFS
jgi:Zn-finger nucleic acid-binding protein